MNLYYLLFQVFHGLGKSISFGTSLVIIFFVFCYLNYSILEMFTGLEKTQDLVQA
jgi:uncharacterized membrane protein